MRKLAAVGAAATFMVASFATMGAAAAAPGGANACTAYDAVECPFWQDNESTGGPSGNGGGNSNTKWLAGEVGNADEKNPPGQVKKELDAEAGYECDTNQGIALGNPAHTGCDGGIG